MHWIKFQATNFEIREFLGTCCPELYSSEMSVFLRKGKRGQSPTLLLDGGSKLTAKGGGWYRISTYSAFENDIPFCIPGKIGSASF